MKEDILILALSAWTAVMLTGTVILRIAQHRRQSTLYNAEEDSE